MTERRLSATPFSWLGYRKQAAHPRCPWRAADALARQRRKQAVPCVRRACVAQLAGRAALGAMIRQLSGPLFPSLSITDVHFRPVSSSVRRCVTKMSDSQPDRSSVRSTRADDAPVKVAAATASRCRRRSGDALGDDGGGACFAICYLSPIVRQPFIISVAGLSPGCVAIAAAAGASCGKTHWAESSVGAAHWVQLSRRPCGRAHLVCRAEQQPPKPLRDRGVLPSDRQPGRIVYDWPLRSTPSGGPGRRRRAAALATPHPSRGSRCASRTAPGPAAAGPALIHTQHCDAGDGRAQ